MEDLDEGFFVEVFAVLLDWKDGFCGLGDVVLVSDTFSVNWRVLYLCGGSISTVLTFSNVAFSDGDSLSELFKVYHNFLP